MENQTLDLSFGKHVIVRAEGAGVFFGILVTKQANEVELKDVRKIYYWEGACAVEELALNGVVSPNNCKFTVVLSQIIVNNYLQIIPCSPKAIKILTEVFEWKKNND